MYAKEYIWGILSSVARFVKIPSLFQYLKIFANIFEVYLILGKVLCSLWYNLYAFGEIFIAENDQILKTKSGRLVALILSPIPPMKKNLQPR